MEDRAKRSRKWGFACLNCRKKKVRCDGGKPQCSICVKAGDDCAYKASDAVNSDLTAELRKKEDEFASLKDHLQRLSLLPGPARDAALSELVGSFDRVSPDDDTVAESSPAETVRASELSVDDTGHVRHYGATSRFHSRPYENQASEPDLAEEDYHRKWLRSNARFQPSWEAKAVERLREPSVCIDIEPTNAKILLEIYWAWQAPLHNYVYRRCFYRDMALGGPYFSTFLLYVLFAHAGRHIRADDPRFPNFDKGEHYMVKVKQLLMHELETPRIPTIQGLLILGGRQCAIGKTSEGWLYTSMAVSMIKDLGLHLRKDAGSLLKNLEPDDLEARKRLYLSAFVWDKSISLCIGRQPSLPEMPYSRNCLLDDADNLEIWRPEHLDDLSAHYPQPTYVYNTDHFMSFVNLSVIINQVYATVYGDQATFSPILVYELEKKLRNLYKELPRHLRMPSLRQSEVAPPPHIATANILYHTILILLFRPFYQTKQITPALRQLTRHAHTVCREEAEAVNAKFRAYGRTYNYRNQTHLLSYCVYTAATVDVQGMQSRDPMEAKAATERLEVTLRMLDTEVEQTPGVRKSVDIIRAQIDQIGRQTRENSPSGGSAWKAQAVGASPHLSSPGEGANPGSAIVSPPPVHPPEMSMQQFATQPVYQPFCQQGAFAAHDPMATGQTFDNLGDMGWFDWNDLDISGGFGSYGYSQW